MNKNGKNLLHLMQVDELIKSSCAHVEDPTLYKQLVVDMVYTLGKFRNGFGLAAPQVGINIRLFIVRLNGEGIVAMFNPSIVSHDDTFTASTESCLSCSPDIHKTIKRANRIKVAYQMLSGRMVYRELEGFDACVFQHELDHLNGRNILSLTEAEYIV